MATDKNSAFLKIFFNIIGTIGIQATTIFYPNFVISNNLLRFQGNQANGPIGCKMRLIDGKGGPTDRKTQ